MDGLLVGVFGTEAEAKEAIESSLGKKSEAEGTVVYHRTDSGKKVSLLDDSQFPERIQGYARVASIADHALYVFPRSGRLSTADGELAFLLESFALKGTIELLDSTVAPETAREALRGTAVADYPAEERNSASSVLDISRILPRADASPKGTLIFVDRAFTVKGVGTVALGFIISGSVSVHDKLRPIPGREGLEADVKGIQINDEDYETAGRGIRVGLSLRNVEPGDLEKARWLDDGTFSVSDSLGLGLRRVPFYRQPLAGRELHLQLPGAMQPASIGAGPSEDSIVAKLQAPVPVWEGMSAALLDLNAKSLRVAAGCTYKF